MATGQVRVLLLTPGPNAQHGNDGRHLATCPHLSELLRLGKSQRLLEPTLSKNCSETTKAEQRTGENSAPSLWDICTQAVLRPAPTTKTSHSSGIRSGPDADEIRTYLAEHWACVVCRRFIHDNPGNARAGSTNYPVWCLPCTQRTFSQYPLSLSIYRDDRFSFVRRAFRLPV